MSDRFAVGWMVGALLRKDFGSKQPPCNRHFDCNWRSRETEKSVRTTRSLRYALRVHLVALQNDLWSAPVEMTARMRIDYGADEFLGSFLGEQKGQEDLLE